MIFQRKGSGISWLLVGLGNPGSKYESTRHNMGFLAVDGLARRKGFRFNKLRFRAWTAEWMVNGEKVLVMKPQTYMNLSGDPSARRPGSIRSRRTTWWSSPTISPCRWVSSASAPAAVPAATTA